MPGARERSAATLPLVRSRAGEGGGLSRRQGDRYRQRPQANGPVSGRAVGEKPRSATARQPLTASEPGLQDR